MSDLLDSPLFPLFLIIVSCIVLFPIGRILMRLGFGVWWLLLFLVPFGPLVGLWLLAFAKWPVLRRSE